MPVAIRWGRDNGMNFWRGLRVSLTTSLVTAINGGMLELPWKINDEWKVYSNSSRQHKELGNSHNRAIFKQLSGESNPYRYGSNISDSALSSMIETKLKQMGYSDVGISSLEWGNIIILIRNLKNALNTSSDLNNVFIAGISSSPTLDYQTFWMNITILFFCWKIREEMITFTEKILLPKIDSLPGVKKELLKGMVSIALCSINLSVPV